MLGARYFFTGSFTRQFYFWGAGLHSFRIWNLNGVLFASFSRSCFSFDSSSRRNVIRAPTIRPNEQRRLLGTAGDRTRRQFSRNHIGAFISFAAFICGFSYYMKRKWSSVVNDNSHSHSQPQSSSSCNTPSSFNIFPIVSAATIDNSGIPPSRRFNFIADAVEKAAPAVVYIELKERLPFGKLVTTSNGSGFVVRSNGLIVTNAHVVANKAAVSVRFYDGKVRDGTVVAVDPISDLAAIKVDATDLPVLPMGKSSTLRPGEWVIAMGSPLSLSNSVTCGIVSCVDRRGKDLGMKNKDMDYIQTDALITFGNSGGPLVNLDGQVIGINTMKVAAGISFAIPSDYASTFLYKVDEVLKRGEPKKRQWFGMGSDSTRKRFIGITMLTLSQDLILELKTRVPDFPDINGGVLVHKIIVGSPAFKGGVRAGDIIVEINGKPVQSASDVYQMVESTESLGIVAYRGNTRKIFNVYSEEVS